MFLLMFEGFGVWGLFFVCFIVLGWLVFFLGFVGVGVGLRFEFVYLF